MSGEIFLATGEQSVLESDGRALVAIERTGDLSQPVTVTYGVTLDTASAADVAPIQAAVTIPADVARIVVPIDVVDDTLGEPTETFTVSIISVDSGTLLFPRTTRVDILDDETPAPPPVAEPPLVSNFDVVETDVLSGFAQPIAFEFSPVDPTRVYVAEKAGRIILRDLDGDARISTVLDIRDEVNNANDRGLLDIAFHPDFPAEPYIYAFYVVDPPDVAGNSGNAGADGRGNRFAHVARFELNADDNYQTVVPGSKTIIVGAGGQSLADIAGGGVADSTIDQAPPNSELGDGIGGFKQDYIKVDSISHAGGPLEFGPDGALYIAIGDGTAFNRTDPRTLAVQDINSLSGKILRVDPMTGRGLADNPFVDTVGGDLDANAAKVYQSGLRNPFSMSFDVEGKLFIATTGWNTWEEINSGGPGANFGWPFYEGGDNGSLRPTFGYRNLPEAQDFYARVADGSIVITPSYRAFAHADSAPGFQVQAITGADDIIDSPNLPDALQGHYIFTDVVRGEVYSVSTDDRRDVQFLYETFNGFAPVHFKQGPDGNIYYAQLFRGRIGRLDITDPNEPPADDPNPDPDPDPVPGDGPPAPVFEMLGETVLDGSIGAVVEVMHEAAYESQAATVAFSFNADRVGGVQGLFTKDASGFTGGGNHLLVMIQAGQLVVRLQNGSASEFIRLPGIEAGRDYDFALTTGPDGSRVYLDGSEVAQTDFAVDLRQNAEFIQFGGRGWASETGAAGFDAPFAGTIADKRLFDQALEPDQIDALFADGDAPPPSPTNTPPVATDDVAATDENVALTLQPSDLLDNDTDADDDPLAILSVGAGVNGTPVLNADGTVTFTPDADFFGDAAFDYTVSDGRQGTDVGRVAVTVRETVDDPDPDPDPVPGDGPPAPVFEMLGETVLDGSLGAVVEVMHEAAYESQAATVAFSFNADRVGGVQGLFTKDASGFTGGGNHLLVMIQAGQLVVRLQNGSASEFIRLPGIEAGRDYDFALTTGPDGSRVYLDGSEVAQTDFAVDLRQNAEF
ncbi:MAG: PQQ-dependent sugar dehydrogenase, partial [Pseudomonadota bacterium]